MFTGDSIGLAGRLNSSGLLSIKAFSDHCSKDLRFYTDCYEILENTIKPTPFTPGSSFSRANLEPILVKGLDWQED